MIIAPLTRSSPLTSRSSLTHLSCHFFEEFQNCDLDTRAVITVQSVLYRLEYGYVSRYPIREIEYSANRRPYNTYKKKIKTKRNRKKIIILIKYVYENINENG